MLVGYNIGYGCSDESTLGEITATRSSRTTLRAGPGATLMAPEVVPGILLVNRKLPSDGHDLTDLTATLLSYYDDRTAPWYDRRADSLEARRRDHAGKQERKGEDRSRSIRSSPQGRRCRRIRDRRGVRHPCSRKEMLHFEDAGSDDDIRDKLKGLGYIS